MSTTQAMKLRIEQLEATLQTFAGSFIRKPFRTRFLHEALHKPQQLCQRSPHQLFDDRFLGAPQSLPTTGEFWSLEHQGFRHQSWKHCNHSCLLPDGGLIIASSGKWFWARSEPTPGNPGVDYHSHGHA